MIALVDGDVYKYRWAAACEYTLFHLNNGEIIRGKRNTEKYIRENPDVSVLHQEEVIEPVENCLHSVKLSLESLKDRFGEVVVYHHRDGNWRLDLYPEYKHSRKLSKRPYHLDSVIDYLSTYWGSVPVDGMETDDALAIRASELGGSGVICSIDKDLYQVPGHHFDLVSLESRVISKREADFYLYSQVLTGDKTDDIPGIHGIGPVKAANILEGAESSADLFRRCREAWGYSDDMFLTAQLVYLWRKPNDSFLQRKEVMEEMSEV